MACKYYGNCEHQSGWCQSDSMLIKCTYGLNNLCSEQILKIVRLEDENAELKRLLRLALNDFEFIYDEHSCTGECECDTFCPYNMEKYRCLGKWKHAEEALKLIGDEENV